jgi:hypothetical protein
MFDYKLNVIWAAVDLESRLQRYPSTSLGRTGMAALRDLDAIVYHEHVVTISLDCAYGFWFHCRVPSAQEGP